MWFTGRDSYALSYEGISVFGDSSHGSTKIHDASDHARVVRVENNQLFPLLLGSFPTLSTILASDDPVSVLQSLTAEDPILIDDSVRSCETESLKAWTQHSDPLLNEDITNRKGVAVRYQTRATTD